MQLVVSGDTVGATVDGRLSSRRVLAFVFDD